MVWTVKKGQGGKWERRKLFFTERFFLLVVPDSVTKRETHRKTSIYFFRSISHY